MDVSKQKIPAITQKRIVVNACLKRQSESDRFDEKTVWQDALY